MIIVWNRLRKTYLNNLKNVDLLKNSSLESNNFPYLTSKDQLSHIYQNNLKLFKNGISILKLYVHIVYKKHII